MPANVSENVVFVSVDTLGQKLDKPRRTSGYTAWCNECEMDETRVMWHGSTFPVGYVSAPAMDARIEAELHNDEFRGEAGHDVVMMPLPDQPKRSK